MGVPSWKPGSMCVCVYGDWFLRRSPGWGVTVSLPACIGSSGSEDLQDYSAIGETVEDIEGVPVLFLRSREKE